MEICKISKSNILTLIDKKISKNDSQVLGVVKRGSNYVFDKLNSSLDLCLDYDVTLLPPKKYFLPPKEVLLTYKPLQAASYSDENECEPITLVGIHHYDLAAIYLMDRVFSDGDRDDHYIKKRENSLLIGIYPTKPFKYRFSKSVIKDLHYKAAELMLVDMGDNYLVEVITGKGQKYLKGSKTETNTHSNKEIEHAKYRVKDDQKLPVSMEISPEYLAKNYLHRAWKHFGDKCFSCGSCVLVCPTCYCFDIKDEVDLSLDVGRRIRTWDGCMLEDFALVADGHNFRKDPGARFRHRIFRKGKYLPDKYRYFGCVGCGRCAQACIADIAGPVKVFKYILEHQ